MWNGSPLCEAQASASRSGREVEPGADHAERLDRLVAGARQHRLVDDTHRPRDLAVGAERHEGPVVVALDEARADDLGHRHWSRHAGQASRAAADGRLGGTRPDGRMIRVPTPPQHHPSPTELDDLELIVTGAAAPVTGLQRARQPADAGPARDAARGRVRRARRPRGPAAGPRHRGLARRAPHPRAVRPVPTLLPPARRGPGAVRRAHLRARRRRADRHASSTTCAAVGRWCCWRSRAPAPRSSPPPRWCAAPCVAAATLPAADVVVVPLASHGDADVDHALGAQVVGVYADGDPVHGLVDGGELPDELAPRSWRRTGPRPTSRDSCCSSPASPAAASRRWREP